MLFLLLMNSTAFYFISAYPPASHLHHSPLAFRIWEGPGRGTFKLQVSGVPCLCAHPCACLLLRRSWWNQRMTRDARSNAALEVHSRRTRVEPATGWRCRRRRIMTGDDAKSAPLSHFHFRTPCLMIGLVTDTFDLISKQGRRQSHFQGVVHFPFQIRILPLSTDPRPASTGSVGNPALKAECSFSPFFISVLVTLIPILPCPLDPLRFHMPRWSHLIVLHHILLISGLLKRALKGLGILSAILF